MKKNKGFTLLELMVTVAIVGILTFVAIPSLAGLVYRTQLSTNTNEIIALISLARSEAVSSGRTSGVCGSSDGFSCDDDWSSGVAVWVDKNRDGVADSDEIIRFTSNHNNISLSSDTNEVAFDSRGRRIGSNPNFTISHEMCSSRPSLANSIEIGTTGRTSLSATEC